MRLKKFIKLEVKKVLGKRYLTIALIFLAASGYFIQHGIGQYKHILEERDNFIKFESDTFQQFIDPSVYGGYGFRILYEPTPLMAFFDSGVPVPPNMTSIIDGSERMKIYHPLKGQGGFAMIASAFMTFAGFVLLFGSGLVLLSGFLGTKDHEWLRLLEDSTNRKKLFFYLLISKTFILLLFCLVLAGLSFLLFIIKGVAVNAGQVLVIFLAVFAMLLCFLLVGLTAGTLKNRFWSWSLMVITWFILAFFIPVLIYHWTYSRATSIQSPYKMEAANQKLFTEYEKSSKEKGGKFEQSKRGSELEKEMFIIFWEGGLKKAMQNEMNMLNEMKENASFFQNWAALFPSTFFLSVNNEMSSRGFTNLADFYEYTIQKKKDFIWYLARNYILSTQMIFPPFIKGNENIYPGQSQLPGNYNFGLAVTIIWVIVLPGLYWIGLNRMLDHIPETDNDREFNKDDFKKNQTNVVITSDRSLYPKLLVKLRSQKVAFVSIPGPTQLPGEFKVKDLLGLFGMAVPEKLQKKAGKYVYTLEPDDKARVLIEITRSLENNTGIFIFDNFVSELSDDCIEEFTEFVKSFKKGRTLVYFTRSILISTKIADYIHRFTKEKPSY
jgi:hypothetical protein